MNFVTEWFSHVFLVGSVGGNLPLRAEAPPEFCQGAEASPGLHLGQNTGCRQGELFNIVICFFLAYIS